jgi:hypothetical protein
MIMKAVCVSVFTVILLLAAISRLQMQAPIGERECIWHGDQFSCPAFKLHP